MMRPYVVTLPYSERELGKEAKKCSLEISRNLASLLALMLRAQGAK
ncbi:MAG TPA: hypothetical protein VI895_02170 [Bdellovibrionota bacterium]|nr:hypothetical protein [Bdellovibrionota bacterium]